MKSTRIQDALQAASETEAFISGPGCRTQTPAAFQQYFPEAIALVVADEITFDVAGKELNERLQQTGVQALEPFVFPGKPVLHADYLYIARLRDFLQNYPHAIPIAVGSGTINDLVKRASYEVNRRYMVLATAASVDGYSSFGAAINQEGFKKTLECPAPSVIVADTEILRDAPAEMTAAGYADLLSKVPAGADWIIADFVGVDPILPAIWDMVQTDLRTWVQTPEQLKTGDEQAFAYLFEGLTMSGFAMQACRKSRPASGADHLFSHIWEMQHHRDVNGEPISHGFQVAIGTLASTALIEVVFARDLTQVEIESVCERWKSWEARKAEIYQQFRDTPILDRVLDESQAKYLSRAELRARLQLLKTHWESLRKNIATQIIPYQQLKQMLVTADCPVTPEHIHLSRERVQQTYFLAQMIRNRYTILDLAYELNWLEKGVEEIMASEIYLR
ncbi:MAG: sn-glycerol-1-phosphate dehydrogenase [Candidatus Vecturithrix sp.]|jgi:glycerol-1-phosphate dehydrogenase [NAD(P)+]|nr:sn-glycerol-1-phosphate dehydrogenase [Candidatus Vecturithrix sp.]